MQAKFLTLLLTSLFVSATLGGLIAGLVENLQENYYKLQWITSGLNMPSNALPMIEFSFLSKFLDCFGLQEVKNAIEKFIKASSFPNNFLAFNNNIINVTSNIYSVDSIDGFFGNVQLACGQWVGNVKVGSESCFLQSDQDIFGQQVLSGTETLFCGKAFFPNYAAYLNGWIKLKMDNSKDTPFDGYICIKSIKCARAIFQEHCINMSSPHGVLIISMDPQDSPFQPAA